MIRVLFWLFVGFTCAACSEVDASAIVVGKVQSAYSDGEAVVVELKNSTSKNVSVLTDIEFNDPSRGWRELLSVDKRIFVIEIQPGETRRATWRFWTDDFTFSSDVNDGTYRLKFKVSDVDGNVLMEEAYTSEFSVTRSDE